jgi:NAD(P)H-dependent FMN reductase
VIRIGIIVGSTRPGRKALDVAKWVHRVVSEQGGAEFEIVDIKDFDLPLLDEPLPPSRGKYEKEHTKRWSAKIAQFDGFIFVTPEYNHSVPGALKNAIDFLYAEWNDKAAAFVSYGGAGGTRAVEHLRGIMGELKVADVRTQVVLSLYEDFEDYTVFKPRELHEKTLATQLSQLLTWSEALAETRTSDSREAKTA